MASSRIKLRLRQAVSRVRAMSTPFRFDLLALPDELIAGVLEQLDDQESLLQAALTCKRLHSLAEREIYRALLVRSGEEAALLVAAVRRLPVRAKLLKRLNLSCDAETRQNFDSTWRLIALAKNLRELIFESPNCNTGNFEAEIPWENMMAGLFAHVETAVASPTGSEPAPLRNLQALTLHMNGVSSPYWSINQRNVGIFKLPCLQYLMLSCATIDSDIKTWIEAKDESSTPLKKLELVECNISHVGLAAILSLPRALETLVLGENHHNAFHFDDISIDSNHNSLFATNAAATMNALQQQSHSLKFLEYHASHSRPQWQSEHFQSADAVDGRFTNFTFLEEVTLVRSCPIFERAVMAVEAPPALRRLRFISSNPFTYKESTFELQSHGRTAAPEPTLPFLRASSGKITSPLSELEIVVENGEENPTLYSPRHRAFIRRVSKENLGKDLKLNILYTRWSTYFPPFLFGERPPRERLAYDVERDVFLFDSRDESPRPGSRAVQEPDVTMYF